MLTVAGDGFDNTITWTIPLYDRPSGIIGCIRTVTTSSRTKTSRMTGWQAASKALGMQ